MDRIPPQNLDAEKAVLGALLLDPDAFDTVLGILTPDDFYADSHRVIYQAMLELEQKGTPVDIITLTDLLKSQAGLEKAGGAAAVASLADTVASAVGIEHWAHVVREKAILRKVISEANKIVEEAYTEPEDVEQFLSASEDKFLEVSRERADQGYVALPELLHSGIKMLEDFARRKELISGVPSGFDDLDKMTSGFQKQELIIIAGRPSMGKSALALNICQNAAINFGKTSAFFSLEMSKENLLIRLLSAEAKVEQQKLRTGWSSSEDWGRLIRAADKLHNAKIFIDDSSSLNVLQIKSSARRIMHDNKGLDMVVIDYMQLITPASFGKRRSLSREQEVSEISRSLKAMAKELHIPVIALSQLSRAVEHRDDKRPRLADLRESGAIEQDADVVMFVHRPGMYNIGGERDRSGEKKNFDYNPYATNEEGPDRDISDDRICELIVGKQRNGPTGIVTLHFFKEQSRFANRDVRYEKEQVPEIP
jgi:replicative DNA helicase